MPDECEVPVIYVKVDASGSNTGLSWTNAYNDLQHALTEARTTGFVEEIWVAAGVYTPDEPGGSRETSFALMNGLKLYGGFAGWETGVAQRDIAANKTILSGEFDGDDDPTNNSYHVVIGHETNETAVLNGFTVTGGKANGTFADRLGAGGGMYNAGGSPTVINCVFHDNSAGYGGGIFNEVDSHPAIVNCVFSLNTGALYSYGNTTLVNCQFQNNAKSNGGGIYNFGDLSLVNCLFSGNQATGRHGGAILNKSSGTLSLTNCTLVGNQARRLGGGIIDEGAGVTLDNCILWGNSDIDGMGESAQLRAVGESPPVVNYSCIQGWTGDLGGVGNTGDDPSLADADGADDVYGTDDDDARLADGSPCIDSGNNAVVPVDVFDIDGDGDTAEPVPYDAHGTKRFLDDLFTIDTGVGTPPIVDMGAYEYGDDCNNNGVPDDQDIANETSADCSGNGVPDECEPDCNESGLADSCDIAEGMAGDCDANGVPDECDIATGRSVDCNENAAPDTCDIANGTSEDCTENGVPDECDIATGRSVDCNENGVPDTCDIAGGTSDDCTGNGLPDECEPDCNANGIADTCDLEDGMSADCTENSIPDECDIAEGRNDDCDDNGIPDMCELTDCNANGALDVCDIRDGISVDADGDGTPDECCVAPAIYPDTLGPRNRYLSFGTADAGSAATSQTIGAMSSVVWPMCAVRVTLVDLPAPFDALSGTTMWVGEPNKICENSGQGLEMRAPEGCGPAPGLSPETFWSATLQCQPYYTDWSAQGAVYVFHRAVVPGGTYALQTIIEGSGLPSEGNYSAALTMTQGRWGDVCGPGPAGACSQPPEGVVDVANDVLGVLGKFANTLALDKASADVGPATPDRKVDVANDVLLTLAAFGGARYPFVPGDPCNP